MRINQYLAKSTDLSRRSADEAIKLGRVRFNSQPAQLSDQVGEHDKVELDGKLVSPKSTTSVLLNKPVGYVCSRDGQGAKTIYEILPRHLQHLNPVGRLDKNSSGLLLLTNDGQLHQLLSHPSWQKLKVYEIELKQALTESQKRHIEQGVELDDGLSQLQLNGSGRRWTVRMHEGRNRQIRRTFAALGHKVVSLHRVSMGDYELGTLSSGDYREIDLET